MRSKVFTGKALGCQQKNERREKIRPARSARRKKEKKYATACLTFYFLRR
jgi:hypothetical protein